MFVLSSGRRFGATLVALVFSVTSCGLVFGYEGPREGCAVPEETLLDAFEQIDESDRLVFGGTDITLYGPDRPDHQLSFYEEVCEVLRFDLSSMDRWGWPIFISIGRANDPDHAAELFAEPIDDRETFAFGVPGLYLDTEPGDGEAASRWSSVHLVGCVIVRAHWSTPYAPKGGDPESRDQQMRELIGLFPELCE